MDLWDELASQRRIIADVLEGLTHEQWQVQTLCEAWDVHDMAAHLVLPCTFSPVEMLTSLIATGGRPERATLRMTARRGEASNSELIATLRRLAGSRGAPPIIGVLGPYTDSLIHLQDILVPLGVRDDGAAERWRPSLDFLTSRRGRVGFVPKGLPPVRFVASDLDWSHGEGPEVVGPAASLALALTHRRARLDELTGDGAGTMLTWVG